MVHNMHLLVASSLVSKMKIGYAYFISLFHVSPSAHNSSKESMFILLE